MMPSANVEEVQANLPRILNTLTPGEPLIITQDGRPITSLSRTQKQQWPCKAGSAKSTSHWMADDFDAPLR